MTIRAAILLLPLVAFGQTPPPDVDQALRARTSEFFQDFVDQQYRKAFTLVAEEAQDEFFASPKAELREFKINNIEYNDQFTEAVVNLMVKRAWKFQGQEMVPEVPMKTTWKIENGKWVWYNKVLANTWVTAMGPSDITVVSRKPDGTVAGLPDKLDQAFVDAAGQKILQQQSGLDKDEVILPVSKAYSDTVVFHNGAPGSVSLELINVPNIPGFSVKLDKRDVNFGENAKLLIQYEPNPNLDPRAIVGESSVVLVVSPFNMRLGVQLKFELK